MTYMELYLVMAPLAGALTVGITRVVRKVIK